MPPLPTRAPTGPLDIQVNGYAGVDFNGPPLPADRLHEACAALRRDGVQGILATIITAPIPDMAARIQAIVRAIQCDPLVADTIWGLHLEGPFISPETGYVGAHPPTAVCQANCDAIERLLDVAEGQVRLWTLAPEMDPGAAMTQYLCEQNIVVAAGHTNASLSQLQESIDAGLKLFTHLGNGCPQSMPRHDNIIQRVLHLAEQLSISLIADGHHLPRFVLANFLRWIPSDKVIIVTDAIAATSLGPGRYRLGDQWVEVDPDLSTWGEGRRNFAGCATTLPQMKNILCQDLAVTTAQFEQWTEHNPRELLALQTI